MQKQTFTTLFAFGPGMLLAAPCGCGGGYKISHGWEPLGPAGFCDTFGPELSFGKALEGKVPGNIAIAKFTHSGSQMNDWTPAGTIFPHRKKSWSSPRRALFDWGNCLPKAISHTGN